MNYPDGRKMLVGDRLKLWEGCNGTVVCSIDDDAYTTEYPKAEWAYLKSGVLIISDKAGVLHYIQPDQSFDLIEREHEAC
jgi:hypothetical protein